MNNIEDYDEGHSALQETKLLKKAVLRIAETLEVDLSDIYPKPAPVKNPEKAIPYGAEHNAKMLLQRFFYENGKSRERY